MNPYQTYQTYLALKQHFQNSDYDFFQFSGRTTTKPETFEKRKDRWIFDKIGQEYGTQEMLIGFLVSNLVQNQKLYIAHCIEPKCRKIYNEWRGKIDTLSYMFKKDLQTIKAAMDKRKMDFRSFIFMEKDGERSPFLKMAMSGVIQLETFVIFDRVMNIRPYYDARVGLDPVYDEFSLRARKYSPFIEIDKKEFSRLVKEFFC